MVFIPWILWNAISELRATSGFPVFLFIFTVGLFLFLIGVSSDRGILYK
jgi:hypothetical protein